MTIRHIYVSLIAWAFVFIMTPAAAKSTPTMCEFIIVEYQAALDRGDISKREYKQLLRNCQRRHG